MFTHAGSSLLRAEGFFRNMDVLYGGLGISTCSFLFLSQKKLDFFSAVQFYHFLVLKTLDPYWMRIRIGIQPKLLDPDPYPIK
jgi:hypothetical protein